MVLTIVCRDTIIICKDTIVLCNGAQMGFSPKCNLLSECVLNVRTYVCVCMYVCMCVYVCICMYHVCMYECMYVWMHICTTKENVLMSQFFMLNCIGICIMFMYYEICSNPLGLHTIYATHIHKHIHKHTQTHTYTHTHTHSIQYNAPPNAHREIDSISNITFNTHNG